MDHFDHYPVHPHDFKDTADRYSGTKTLRDQGTLLDVVDVGPAHRRFSRSRDEITLGPLQRLEHDQEIQNVPDPESACAPEFEEREREVVHILKHLTDPRLSSVRSIKLLAALFKEEFGLNHF